MSLRRIAREFKMSTHTAYLILKEDLNFHPYPITIHFLNEDDPQSRVEFSRQFLEKQNKGYTSVDKTIWSDESRGKIAVDGHTKVRVN